MPTKSNKLFLKIKNSSVNPATIPKDFFKASSLVETLISLLNICDNPRVAKIGIQSSKMTCMELTALNLL